MLCFAIKLVGIQKSMGHLNHFSNVSTLPCWTLTRTIFENSSDPDQLVSNKSCWPEPTVSPMLPLNTPLNGILPLICLEILSDAREWMIKAHCLLVPSADNLCKQFGPRSGPTKCRAWSRSKPFDNLMKFQKEISKKLILKKLADDKEVFNITN